MDLLEEIVEATTKQLQRKQKTITRLFPTFPDRVQAVAGNGGIRLQDIEDELWKFRVSSGTKKDVWYDIYVRFKDIIPTLAKIIRDRRLWVGDKSRIDRRKLARKFLTIVNVELKCSCPAFQYWGPAYILSLGKYAAKYTNREIRPPRIRNPRQYGAYCKHLANFMKVYPFYADTMMQWLSDFYEDEIRTFEKETKKEYGWIKKVVKALGRKKKETEEDQEGEEEVKEVVAVRGGLQKKLIDYYKDSGETLRKTTWPTGVERDHFKFWLLTNGRIIPVDYSHYDTIKKVGIKWNEDLRKEGAVDGYLSPDFNEMGIRSGEKGFTSKQISKLKQLAAQYRIDSIYVDYYTKTEKENFYVSFDSLDRLEYLLKYGKEESREGHFHEMVEISFGDLLSELL